MTNEKDGETAHPAEGAVSPTVTTGTTGTAGKRNNGIELLRFLFTTIIILFHINLDLWDRKKTIALVRGIPVTFFRHGNMGVEFFFLVTGYLMAASIYKKIRAGKETPGLRTGLVRETMQFIEHKAKAILPYYLTACALTPLVRFMTGRSLGTSYFVKRLPSLLFLQRMGLGRPFIGCTWYLSSLFIAMFFVYPLCRRFYRAYTRIFAPLLCAALLGAIIALTGSLGDIEDWFFFTYKTNIRAFAEMSMGATAFELSRLIRGRVRSVFVRALITLSALAGLALTGFYMCSSADESYGILCFYLLFIVVTMVFSGEGLLCHAGVFRSPFFAWLGAVSLPMYVSQTLLRMLVPCCFEKSGQWTQCFLIYAGVLLLGIVMHTAVTLAGERSLPKIPGLSLLRVRALKDPDAFFRSR